MTGTTHREWIPQAFANPFSDQDENQQSGLAGKFHLANKDWPAGPALERVWKLWAWQAWQETTPLFSICGIFCW